MGLSSGKPRNENLNNCREPTVVNTEIKESKMSDTSHDKLKKFTKFDKGVKLVSQPSDLDPCDDDDGVLRAVLSCGHVTDPDTLMDCCRAQLKDGKTEFRCPLCSKQWPYDEVRKLAKLTTEEKSTFEEQLGTNTVKKKVKFRECPGCGSFIERSDESNLCVHCSVCTVKNSKTYEFCWKCLREWNGLRNRTNRCGNEGCSIDEKLLRTCPMITLTYFKEHVECPKIRACTSCGVLIEHNTTGCNNMECPECKIEFCFICLELGHFISNTNPNYCTIAPRQIQTVS